MHDDMRVPIDIKSMKLGAFLVKDLEILTSLVVKLHIAATLQGLNVPQHEKDSVLRALRIVQMKKQIVLSPLVDGQS